MKREIGRAPFDDRPFRINLLGIRREDSIRDTFDDRMVVFFTLPAGDAKAALTDAGIEAEMVDEVVAAAKAVNDDAASKSGAEGAGSGRGVRRVACNSVMNEDGVVVAGHRVVAVFPISTDPGLVRTDARMKRFEDARDAAEARTRAFEEARKQIEAERKTRDDNRRTVAAERGQKGLSHPTPAEEAVRAATKKIRALRRAWSLRNVKTSTLDKKQARLRKRLAKRQKSFEAATKKRLSARERRRFSGYKAVLDTKHGYIGELHALFPPGVQEGKFRLGIHKASSDTGSPALKVQDLDGHRVASIEHIERIFRRKVPAIVESAKSLRAFRKTERRLEQRRTEALAAAKNSQDKQLAESDYERGLAAALDAKAEREREYLEVVRVREGAPRPEGTRIGLGCVIEANGQRRPLRDTDRVTLRRARREVRDGRYVREHFYSIARGRRPKVKLASIFDPDKGAFVATRGVVVPDGLRYVRGDRVEPAPPKDIVEVEMKIAGTNIHRGHGVKVAEGSVSGRGKLDRVANWSLGCQVYPLFLDFNFFIRLASLCKTLACHAGRARTPACRRVVIGTPSAPGAAVLAHVRTRIDDSRRPLVPEELQRDLDAMEDELQGTYEASQRALETICTQIMREEPNLVVAASDTWEQTAIDMLEALQTRIVAPVKGAPAKSEGEYRAELARLDAKRRRLVEAYTRQIQAPGLSAQLEQLLLHLEDAGKAQTYDQADVELARRVASVEALMGRLEAGSPLRPLAERCRQALSARRAELRRIAARRARLFAHDHVRECDITGACNQSFDYTLIELDQGASTSSVGEMLDVEDVDEGFAMKADGRDVNPLWNAW